MSGGDGQALQAAHAKIDKLKHPALIVVISFFSPSTLHLPSGNILSKCPYPYFFSQSFDELIIF